MRALSLFINISLSVFRKKGTRAYFVRFYDSNEQQKQTKHEKIKFIDKKMYECLHDWTKKGKNDKNIAPVFSVTTTSYTIQAIRPSYNFFSFFHHFQPCSFVLVLFNIIINNISNKTSNSNIFCWLHLSFYI